MELSENTGRRVPQRGGLDEQFEYEGPKTLLDELFDHHGYQVHEVIEEEEGEE